LRVGGRWVGEVLGWVLRLVGNRCGLGVDGRLVYRVVGLWRSRLKWVRWVWCDLVVGLEVGRLLGVWERLVEGILLGIWQRLVGVVWCEGLRGVIDLLLGKGLGLGVLLW